MREHPYLLVGGVAGIFSILVASFLLELPGWAFGALLAGWALVLNVVARIRR